MKFLVQKATFITHGITTDGLQPNPVTVQVTVSMSTPTDKQVAQSTVNSVHNSAASPWQSLWNLTNEDIPFLWPTKHQEAFIEAKTLISYT